jgi:hypothetical protein
VQGAPPVAIVKEYSVTGVLDEILHILSPEPRGSSTMFVPEVDSW